VPSASSSVALEHAVHVASKKKKARRQAAVVPAPPLLHPMHRQAVQDGDIPSVHPKVSPTVPQRERKLLRPKVSPTVKSQKDHFQKMVPGSIYFSEFFAGEAFLTESFREAGILCRDPDDLATGGANFAMAS
jgi:hypothetical protein